MKNVTLFDTENEELSNEELQKQARSRFLANLSRFQSESAKVVESPSPFKRSFGGRGLSGDVRRSCRNFTSGRSKPEHLDVLPRYGSFRQKRTLPKQSTEKEKVQPALKKEQKVTPDAKRSKVKINNGIPDYSKTKRKIMEWLIICLVSILMNK